MQGEMTIIKTDGTTSATKLDAPPTLEQLQDGVGGYIETVPYFDKYCGKRCVAFCNEAGKLHDLEVNDAATTEWILVMGRSPNDVLVGNVVIITGDQELLDDL